VLSFYILASVAAVICFILAATWLLAPQVFFSILGLDYSQPAGLVSRRSAALFAGIGLMLFLARNAQPSPSREALSIGFVVACLVLAGLGIFEFIKKRVTIAILLAVVVEVLLAAAFIAWALPSGLFS
jgi:hypothetical protein